MVNGKIYVGKDVDHAPTYLGSGVLLSRAIKKYGVENFQKVILETCSTLEQLNAQEVHWIKKLNATNRKIGYNIAEGGTGGNTLLGKTDEEKRMIVEKRRETTRKKYLEHPELLEITRKKRSDAMKLKWTPEYTEMMRKKMTGRVISWKDKIIAGVRNWHEHNEVPPMSDEARRAVSIRSRGRILTSVSSELEDKIVELYPEWGVVQMSKKLKEMGLPTSQYIIRRTLQKRGIYKKYKKGKFHAPPRVQPIEQRIRHSAIMRAKGRKKIDPMIESKVLDLYKTFGIRETYKKINEAGVGKVGKPMVTRIVKENGVCRKSNG